MIGPLGGEELRSAVLAALDLLKARRASIDAANVYPVPDGDTGTNLVLTFDAIARAVDRVAGTDAEIARAVKTGSLMGARGNSGVIMAQLLRGLVEPLEVGPADQSALARGFKRGVELAYEAVLEPAEGTILTVAREAAAAAQGSHGSVPALLEAAHAAAVVALGRTREENPVLARAGVVDAGGMGLVAVLEAFASSAAGRAVAQPAATPAAIPAPCDGSPTYPYEVQYLLAASDETAPAVRQLLGTIGDSVAVIGGEGTWRIHVHTDDITRAIRIGEGVGTVSSIEVVSFAEQIASRDVAVRPPPPLAARAPGERGIEVARAPDAAALIAVVSGAGVQQLFRDLGAVVVDGGSTMNPSVGELLDAIRSVPTRHVVVLPNNDNVFAAAQAASGETDKDVRILRTSDLGEGLAAACAYGEARGVDDNVGDMREALARVRTGQVVIAIDSAETPIGRVDAGDAIGFAEGAPVAVEKDPATAAAAVARALLAGDGELLTVIAGAGAAESERAHLAETLRALRPGLTVEMHDGAQPVHRYVLAIE